MRLYQKLCRVPSNPIEEEQLRSSMSELDQQRDNGVRCKKLSTPDSSDSTTLALSMHFHCLHKPYAHRRPRLLRSITSQATLQRKSMTADGVEGNNDVRIRNNNTAA